jgi:hypothetical protein
MTPHVRPMFRQHLAAKWINLDLPTARHLRTIEAEINATDAGE